MVKNKLRRSKRASRARGGVNYKERCSSCKKRRVIKRHVCKGRK